MSVPSLRAIYRYPVKSLRGESFDSLEVMRRGFACDREWMVVDPDGRFLTQRQQPRMSLVDATVTAAGELRLRAPGMPALAIPGGAADYLPVEVWGDRIEALAAGPDADAWLSRFLGIDCRLVRFADDRRRDVDPGYAHAGDEVGFADGFPFLLISQASLDDLNRRLESCDEPAVPMTRFRPNLVVDGCEPYAEDAWRRIRIGDLTLRVVKACSRCIIPTIDPATARRGPEPLRTLMTYRRRDSKVYFGQNLVHDGPGELRTGMPVEVLA